MFLSIALAHLWPCGSKRLALASHNEMISAHLFYSAFLVLSFSCAVAERRESCSCSSMVKSAHVVEQDDRSSTLTADAIVVEAESSCCRSGRCVGERDVLGFFGAPSSPRQIDRLISHSSRGGRFSHSPDRRSGILRSRKCQYGWVSGRAADSHRECW
jgi:hypothetical protein